MKRAAAMRPCLAAGVCRDVGVEVWFGIGCAGAHVSREIAGGGSVALPVCISDR